MARTNRYDHFCPVARSLEVIGEKWSLLIIRELLPGPRRFTDLQRGMASITAKWLTLRLRELEAAGLVMREQEEGRREVWYRLTQRGEDLRPVVGALNAWGMRHAMRPMLPGEKIHPARLARSFIGFLNATDVRPARPLGWRVDFDGDAQDLWFDGEIWTRQRVEMPALVIRTTVGRWAALLTNVPERPAIDECVALEGDAAEAERFRQTLEGILQPA
ncbi:MAG: winged helix-turn-helix transcriptional regulator [Dehalococcoidia bacterium]